MPGLANHELIPAPSNLMRVPSTIKTFQALPHLTLAAHVMGANATHASDRFRDSTPDGIERSPERPFTNPIQHVTTLVMS